MELNTLGEMAAANSADNALDILVKNIHATMSTSIPKVIPKHKQNREWISQDLVSLLKEKDKVFRKWKRRRSCSKLKASYRRLVKQVKKVMFISKTQYFQKMFSKVDSPITFWKTLNEISGRKGKEDIPTLIKENGIEADSAAEKAEVLRNQFASVFTSSCKEIPVYDVHDLEEIPQTNAGELSRIIDKLPMKKAMGKDGISVSVIKNCSLVLVPCLAVLTDRILREGSYPKKWKVAVIVPIAKVASSQNPGDYRPVSLLSILSKVVEKYVNNILLSQISPRLSNVQFGFRECRSTIDAFLMLQHHIFRGFDKCTANKKASNVAVVYFDIAKAFDTVPHTKLLHTVEQRYSLPHYLMRFLSSYLSDRWMQVGVEYVLSKKSPVTSGVPQGSVIGPTLFLAYIDVVSDTAMNESSDLILFADDMAFIHPLHEEDSVHTIQEDINQLAKTTQNLELSLNTIKCKYQIISPSQRSNPKVKFTLNGVDLEEVAIYRYLGIQVDNKLNFALQTSKGVTSAKRGIGELCRTLRKWGHRSILSKAITGLVLPAFFYGIEAWYPPFQKEKLQLERVLKFAARMILNNFDHEIEYTALLDELKWKPIYQQVVERQILLIRKYLDGRRFISNEVFQLEVLDSQIRTSQRIASQRKKHHLQLQLRRGMGNNLGEKMAAAEMRRIWNHMDEETVALPFEAFKMEVKVGRIYKGLLERTIVEMSCT